MRLLRIKAIAQKEILQIRRDPFSLAMAFLMPVILLVIFGYAITIDINDIPVVVYDLDKTSMSREFVAELRESGYFTMIGYADRYHDIDQYLDSGKAKLAVMIPLDFSKNIVTIKKAHIGVIMDGSDANTATIAQGYITAITEQYAQRLAGVRIASLIDVRSRVWYNSELKSKNFIIPGLIALIMSVIAALLTSLTIAKEWDRGTMEQLIATPIKTSELIIGKLIPYFIIGLIDTVIAVFMGTILFAVPLRGSLVLLFSFSCIFLFGGLCWGVFISIVARTQVVASQMALLSTFLPAFLLSGFLFAISNMPKPLQVVTYLFPARYFVSILKDLFLKGSSFNLLVGEALLLTLYGIIVFVLANKKFKKNVV